MKPRQIRRSGALNPLLVLSLLASISYVHAQTNGVWNSDSDGNWSDPAKWTGGNVASGAGAIADFNTINLAANRTVTIDAPFTIGSLLSQDTVGANGSWTFAGTSTLTLDSGTASQPVLNIINRLPVISAPLAGTNGFSKTGAGMVTLSGNNSGLSGIINLPDVTGSSSSTGLTLSGTSAVGGITTININGTATSGQYLALYGTTTVGSGVTINLGSLGGTSSAPGGLRAEGTNTDIVTVQGPVNITLSNSRIANNSAKRLDITGAITGGTNNIVFRFGKNEGIHLTNTGNSWTGTTTHSEETLWFDPGTLPANTNLAICASNPGTVQTNGTFSRALGDAAGQVQFALSSGRAQGFGARGGALTLNFGGAGADVLFDTNAGAVASRIRTSTLVLNGGTADSNITLVNPIDVNGAARTLQVSSQTATLQGGIKGGTFAVSKTGAGTLVLPNASTWTGDLTLANNAGVVRLGHNEALGTPATAKSVNTTGSNQIIGILELPGGLNIDDNKTLKMGGKGFYADAVTAIGDQSALRSIGTNTWNGSAVIGSSGGAYGIESVSGTLTLGATSATTKLMRNEVTTPVSVRTLSWFGAGDVVMNLQMADNGTLDFNFNKVGSGKLSITRGDNDFDQAPNLRSGITEVVKLADSGTASSLGNGSVGTNINVGATLRYLGTGDSCNRPIGILQTGATLDSSGTGPLVLSSATLSHQTGTTSTVCAPFALGATTLYVNDPSGIAVGQTIAATNVPAGTTVISVNVDTRALGISQATTAASTTGLTTTLTNASTINRTLTLTGGNTGENIFAAALSNPGTGKLGITKTGAGKWNLTGATKTNSGPLSVQQGTLGITGPMPAGTVAVDSGATLSLSNTSLSGAPPLSIAGTLDLAGPVFVNMSAVNSPGTYTALEYGALTGSGTLTTLYRGAAFDTTTSLTSTSLTVSPGIPLTWTGASNGTWDVITTPNWIDGSSNPETFYFLDTVTFDETGALQPIVTLAAEVRPAGTTVNNPTTDYSLTGSGFISGSGSLVKSGAANLTVSTANTFTGGVTINGGTLRIGNNAALGVAGQAITINAGGTLDTRGAYTVSRDYAATISGTGVGGAGAIINSMVDNNFGFRTLTLAADATIGGTNRWDVRPITGGTAQVDLAGFKLTKTGANYIALVDGSLTADGEIDIDQGILGITRMVVSGNERVMVKNGAILRFEGNTTGSWTDKPVTVDNGTINMFGSNYTLDAEITVVNTGTFDIAFTRTFTATRPVGGTGALNFISSGTGAAGVLVLQNDNTYAGATTVDTGTLRIGNRTTTGSINALSVTLANNGNLQLSRSESYTFPNTIQGTGGVIVGANATVTAPEYDSIITLTGANTFTGGISVYSGGLKIQNPAVLGTGPKTINLATNGTNGRPQFYLDGSGGNITLPTGFSFVTSSQNLTHPAIGNLAGDNVIEGTISLTSGGGNTAITVLGGTLTLNGGISNPTTTNRELVLGGNVGTTGTVNGIIANGADAFRLNKSYPGTWKLTNANTYTGTTTVNAGTLLVNGIQNVATGAVTVTGGTLGGIGTIGGNITVSAAGTLAPGESVGTLTTVNSVTLNGKLSIEIDGASADKLVVGSTLNITNGTLDLTEINPASGTPIIIASYGALTGTQFATVNGLPSGYTINYNYNSDNQIALVQASGYTSWIAGFGLSVPNQDKGADPDGDGRNNLYEFAFKGDPTSGSNNGLLKSEVQDATTPVGNEFTLVAAVRRGATFASGAGGVQTGTKDGVIYTVEGTVDLGTFTGAVSHGGASNTATGLPDLTGTDWEYHTFSLDSSEGLAGKGFLRVKVSE